MTSIISKKRTKKKQRQSSRNKYVTSKQAVYSEDGGHPEYEFAREAREQAKLNQIFHGREDRLTNKFHELEEWEKRLKIVQIDFDSRNAMLTEKINELNNYIFI